MTSDAVKPVGVLLVNLGSPDSPGTSDVRRYLAEFLSDPLVIDLHPVARAIFLYGFILPFRPRKSAEAYRKIWTEQGSPLLVNSRELHSQVADRLGDVPVELAMRYGKPTIRGGLRRLHERGTERVVILPLYPQYAASSTESTLVKVREEAPAFWDQPELVIVPPFYDHDGFLDAFAEVGRPALEEFEPDHVLMSFHGLPEQHVRKGDPTGSHCLATDSCCNAISEANRNCYRAQCYATARELARRLGLGADAYSVAFQSRLGRTPWIRPYTDLVLSGLPGRGVKKVVVYCPSFVADCLETLEEIAIRGRESFRAAGGEDLRMISSLNAHPRWVDAVVDLLETATHQGVRS